MNINWNKALIYTVGGAAGAVTAIFITQFVMDVIAAKNNFREIEDMVEDTDDDEENTKTNVLRNGWKLTSGKVNYSQDKEDLSVLVGKYKKEEIDQDESTQHTQYTDPVEPVVAEVDRTKPYPISYEEYIGGFGGKKKITKIMFYLDDEVCTDEDGKVLTKAEKYIGNDLINMFGGISGDQDVAYIRNDKLKCDYHVIAIDAAYESSEEDSSVPRKNHGTVDN